MRFVIIALLVAACGRAQVGLGPTLGAGQLGDEPGLGATAEVGGWLPGERFGVFAVAEVPGYAVGNDADPVLWVGLDARSRRVLHRSGRLRIPFSFGGGAGFEVAYVNDPLISALAEIGIEADVGPLVFGARARERLGAYLGAAGWQSSTNLLLDVGYRFD